LGYAFFSGEGLPLSLFVDFDEYPTFFAWVLELCYKSLYGEFPVMERTKAVNHMDKTDILYEFSCIFEADMIQLE